MTSQPPGSDLALLAAARQGGPPGRAAFDELVRRHQAWLVRLLTYVLHDPALAEDVAQDSFMRAYQHLPEVAQIDSFRAWLRTIATRLAFNARRDTATRRRYQDQAPGPTEPSGLDERAAAKDTVLTMLERLPYSYREVLVLRHVEELEILEIARLLDVGESAAKMRLQRARQAFLKTYDEVTHREESAPES